MNRKNRSTKQIASTIKAENIKNEQTLKKQKIKQNIKDKNKIDVSTNNQNNLYLNFSQRLQVFHGKQARRR